MTGRLDGRLIALGVTGSIAAYKAAELLRLLQAEGAEVAVLLTPSATRFVAPLTLAALSAPRRSRPTSLDLLPDGRIGHIVVADSADAIVVAPATAHWLGAMAGGLAGDASPPPAWRPARPVVVAPAMDGDMYAHPATRANVARLRDASATRSSSRRSGRSPRARSGVGRLAELADDRRRGRRGRGRPADPRAGRRPPPAAAGDAPRDADLAGRHIVSPPAARAEPIDPVRFIGNRSTGRMGVAHRRGRAGSRRAR